MIHSSLAPRIACVAAFAVVVGWVAEAHACVTTTCAVKNPPPNCVRDPVNLCWLAGAPLQWKQACVAFSVDERGIPSLGLGYADTEALVTSSFALWPTASCADGSFPSIAVKSAGALSCTGIEYNPEGPNANSVIFQTNRWSHDPVAIGVTTVSFNPETGRIVDADIEINMTGGGLDFLATRFVVAHEAGHYFGLDHSALDSAVMYSQSERSDFDAPPSLTPDDVTAICVNYPINRTVGACDFEPEKGYSPVCGGDIEASCAMGRRSPARPALPDFVIVVATLGAFLARTRRTRRNTPPS